MNYYDKNISAFAFKNSLSLPFLNLIKKHYDTKEILVWQERFFELSSKEFLREYGLCQKDLENIIKFCLLENIKLGVSEIDVVSLDPVLCKNILEEFGLKGRIYLKAKDIDDLPEIVKEFKSSKIELAVMVDPYLDGDDLTNTVSLYSGKYKLPVLVTLFDDLQKTGMLNSLFDMPPADYIEKVGLFDRDCSVYGGIYADKDDFAKIASYGAKVVVCLFDSLNLGKGVANVYSMKNMEINVKLCSPINNNIIDEIKLAGVVNRGLLKDPTILKFDEVLEFALSERGKIEFDQKLYEKVKIECEKIIEKLKEKN